MVNLDGLSPEELEEKAKAFLLLARYADWKAAAMRVRANGAVQTALIYETYCDDLYDKLPEWARW